MDQRALEMIINKSKISIKYTIDEYDVYQGGRVKCYVHKDKKVVWKFHEDPDNIIKFHNFIDAFEWRTASLLGQTKIIENNLCLSYEYMPDIPFEYDLQEFFDYIDETYNRLKDDKTKKYFRRAHQEAFVRWDKDMMFLDENVKHHNLGFKNNMIYVRDIHNPWVNNDTTTSS